MKKDPCALNTIESVKALLADSGIFESTKKEPLVSYIGDYKVIIVGRVSNVGEKQFSKDYWSICQNDGKNTAIKIKYKPGAKKYPNKKGSTQDFRFEVKLNENLHRNTQFTIEIDGNIENAEPTRKTKIIIPDP